MNDRFASYGPWQRWGPPALMALVVLAFGFAELDRYNITWDEAVGDLFFGQRYWSFFTTWDPVYLDVSRNPYPPGHVPNFHDLGHRPLQREFYPLGPTLAIATSELLSRRLGWLDPFDGIHAVNLLLTVPFLFVWYRFLLARFGLFVAVLAPLFLFLSPRIVCDLMANIKDYPEMLLFPIALAAFLTAYERGSVAGVLGAGVLWGLAWAAKINAVFVVPIVGLVVLCARRPAGWRLHTIVPVLAVAGVLGTLTCVAVWPWMYADPFGRLREHFDFVLNRQSTVRPESVAPPLPQILYTTPIPVLALFVVGLVPMLKRAVRREPTAWLLLSWVAVVAGRLFVPKAVNYDGVRHFLELFPAFTAIAAVGAVWLVELGRRLAPHAGRIVAGMLFVCVPLASMTWSLVRCHPFEIAYWNALIGGLQGAQARRMAQAGDYWGASYRLGLDWLNENAAPGSPLAVGVIEHAVRAVAPVRLRSDVRLVPVWLPLAFELDPRWRPPFREPTYVMFVPRADWMNALMLYCLRNLTPVKVWTLDGAPVLLIYRYEPSAP